MKTINKITVGEFEDILSANDISLDYATDKDLKKVIKDNPKATDKELCEAFEHYKICNNLTHDTYL